MSTCEVDAWWGSYSIRSLIPSIAVSVLLSCLIWVAIWLAGVGSLGINIALALMALFWIGLALNWGYRIFAFNYRLTTRRLFHETGLLRRSIQEVNLDHVTEAVVKQGPFSRLLKVGQVHVAAQGSARQWVILNGVFAPEFVAEKILALSRERQRTDAATEK